MKRNFIIGSDWLYFKFYTGYKGVDELLVKKIDSFTKKLLKEKWIVEFFFIRYDENGYHIRLRLKISDHSYYSNILNLFYKTFSLCLDYGLVYNIQCDTYKREIERYTEEAIEKVEKIFFYDSKTIIEILKKNDLSDTKETERWLMAIKLMDNFLEACGYDLQIKKDFTERAGLQFKKEFNFFGHAYKKQLDDKYRANRKIIEQVFDNNSELNKKYKKIIDYHLKNISEQLKIISSLKNGDQIKEKILGSLIHMSINRVFRSKNRIWEMVLYDFITRCYTSQLARNKHVK